MTDAADATGTDSGSELYCPTCQEAMRHSSHAGVEVQECRFCDGLWLDRGKPEALVRMDVVPRDLLEPVAFDDSHMLLKEGLRLCPRCAAPMEVTTCLGVTLDVCPGCLGLFLDRWELKKLLA